MLIKKLFLLTSCLAGLLSPTLSQTSSPSRIGDRNARAFSLDSLIAQVSQESLTTTIKQLSGVLPVTLADSGYTITTRYAPTIGNRIARAFISQKMAGDGVGVESQLYPAPSGDPFVSFTSLSFSTDKRKGWLCTTKGEILVSSDSGTTWTSKRAPGSYLSDGLSAIRCIDSLTVYAVGYAGQFVRTSDGGDSWETLSTGEVVDLSDLFIDDSKHVWVVGARGIMFKTTDGGNNWQQIALPEVPLLTGIWFIDDVHGLIIGTKQQPYPQQPRGVVFETKDGGVSWTQVSGDWGRGLRCIQFFTADLGWIGGNDGAIFHTTDGGSNWIRESLPDTTDAVSRVFFVDGLQGWATTSQGSSEGGIYHTVDAGQSWTTQSATSQLYGLTDIFFFSHSVGIAVGSGETFLRTWDGGETWLDLTTMQLENVIGTLQGKTYPDQYYLLCAHMDDISGAPWTLAPGADDNATGVATVLEAARVLRTYEFDYTIKFATFPDEEVSLRGSTINAQQASWGGQSLLGVINVDMIGYDGNGDRVFTLFSGTDSASNTLGERVVDAISRYQIDLLPNTVHNQGPSDALSYWAAGYPTVLLIEDMFSDFNPSYHSTADTWEKLDPLYLTDITKAVVATLAELAGLRGPATDVEVAEELPSQFILHQNYPNPFNPTTIIRYELPSSGFVSLTIYSVLGERVATLIEQIQKAGNYHAEWNAGDRSSGVYFYRLHVGPVHGEVTAPFLEIKKMVLVK